MPKPAVPGLHRLVENCTISVRIMLKRIIASIMKESDPATKAGAGSYRPALTSLTEVRNLKLRLELGRGMGGRIAFHRPVSIEPPFNTFNPDVLEPVDLFEAGLPHGFEPIPMRRLSGGSREPGHQYQPDYLDVRNDIRTARILMSPTEDVTPGSFKAVLEALTGFASPVSFEIIGTHATIRCQLAGPEREISRVTSQLYAQYPESEFEKSPHDGALGDPVTDLVEQCLSTGTPVLKEYRLSDTHAARLSVFSDFRNDPLNVLVGALNDLEEDEFGLVQIQFYPVKNPWHSNIAAAVTDPMDPSRPSRPDSNLLALAKEKVRFPLFAVGITIAASSNELIQRMDGFIHQFRSPNNRLQPVNPQESARSGALVEALRNRVPLRWGMLLSSDELCSIIHPPSPAVTSSKLERRRIKTHPAPEVAKAHPFLLGYNEHRGQPVDVGLAEAARSRHTYIIGAQGSGKTTLLQSMILQDIREGRGVAVLDAHGDLVEDLILPFIPESRWDDVVVLDPSDTDFPVAFNILAPDWGANGDEKTILAEDLVAIFRRLSTSWGDQMNSVLANGVLAFMESSKGGTLLDLRRFLVDREFRSNFLTTVGDAEVRFYWECEFPMLVGKSVGPVLTRLDAFLRPRLVRNMAGQTENKLNFRELMDGQRILLVKLSHGGIGESNAHLLGALVVSKLQQAAMSREDVHESQRVPFYLYIDEFQNFATPSMEVILSGARKYGLGLILAHQYLAQVRLQSRGLHEAVLSQPYTRVCFRVDDADARHLAPGFAHFAPPDFMNLSRGEAIARMDRAEWDFTLKTYPPSARLPEDVAAGRKQRIRDLSRAKYATPRSEVERQWRQSGSSGWTPPQSDDDFYAPRL